MWWPTVPAREAPASGSASRSIGLGRNYAACGTPGSNCAACGSGKRRSPADDGALAAPDHEQMNTTEIRAQLTRLELERITAAEVGLAGNETYMADLEQEIFECRSALTLSAVTEIAVARAAASGPLRG